MLQVDLSQRHSNGALISLEVGAMLPTAWALVDLTAGSLNSTNGDAVRALDTDSALFFDRASQRLSGAFLKIPEVNLLAPGELLAEMPRADAVLHCRVDGLRSAVGRFYSATHDCLVALLDEAPPIFALQSVNVGTHLKLIVSEGQPVAWMIGDASRVLESPKSGPPRAERRGSKEARDAILDYLTIVDDQLVLQLEEGSLAAKSALRKLRGRVNIQDGVGAILVEWIDDILRVFD